VRADVRLASARCAAALMRGQPAALEYDELVIPLPRDGLAAAVAFAARCRFG
jgi:hypothetical protein